jgi:hypothetical protein|tara:strand:+ start:114 stop:227 length:114 start_codon:yes stop_codon:yes gene_type:complete
MAIPAYTPQRKEDIKEEDSLMCVDLMSYVYRPVDGYV